MATKWHARRWSGINLDLTKITWYMSWLLRKKIKSILGRVSYWNYNNKKSTQYAFTLCMLRVRSQGHPGQKWSLSSHLRKKETTATGEKWTARIWPLWLRENRGVRVHPCWAAALIIYPKTFLRAQSSVSDYNLRYRKQLPAWTIQLSRNKRQIH